MAQAVGEWLSGRPAWFTQAQNLVAVRRYALAEELTRHELAQHPRSALALVVLSMVLGRQGRHAEAETAARSALAVQPAYAEGFYFLAVSLINLHRLAEAGTAIDRALELDPAMPKYYALRSQLELTWNYPAQSLATAEEGLRWDPTNLECLLRRLKALCQLAENGPAETTAKTILGLEPGNYLAHLVLGQLLLQRNAHPAAEAHFRAALQQKPDSAEARQGLSFSWKQRYWLPRQMERLDDHIISLSEWLTARLGKAGNVLLFVGVVLVASLLCLPLGLLYGWAYLRWRLAPAVLLLRGRPLGQPWWRLGAAGAGCVASAALAVLVPGRVSAVALAVAPLAALGFWREVWGEPAPEPEREHLEWVWVAGAVAIVLLFWLDDAPPAVRARLVLLAYAAMLSLMVFIRSNTAR